MQPDHATDASPPPSLQAKRFCLALLGFGFLALLATAAFNAAVDPLQQYREPASGARYFSALQRAQNPGLAQHRSYNRVIVGSSMVENFIDAEVDAALGGRTINLALSAMSAYESGQFVRHLQAIGKAQQIIWSVDLVAFHGPPDRTVVPLLEPLYNTRVWDDALYLLPFTTTLASVNQWLQRPGTSPFRSDRARPWFWGDDAPPSAAVTVRGLDPAQLNRVFNQPALDAQALRASFVANVLPVLAAKPAEQRITFIFPPYSALVWADYRQRGQLYTALAFKRLFIAKVLEFKGVEVFDFQSAEAVVMDLANYKDIYHYGPAINRWMTAQLASDAAAGSAYRVTAATLDHSIAQLERLALRVDAAALIAAANVAGQP